MEGREHYNLYYIFLEDRNEHPMPPEQVAAIRERIFTESDP